MLTLSHVRLRRGTRVLLEDATTAVFRGERIGIVGRNGTGKSTLLALVRGEVAPDGGDYGAPAHLAIASVAQELPETPRPLLDYIVDGDHELRTTEAALAEAEAQDDGARIAALHAEVRRLDGYAARSRAGSLADGLGFGPADHDHPVREFSGGLRMRANLARALMRRSDLLLLDEPTNHLDLDAVLWLEDWLRHYSGTLLLVSHDREFLDAVVGRILCLEEGRLLSYAGNYSDFERQHAASLERSRALAEAQAAQVQHVQAFVQRFRATASKARQVQSRLKWLERLPAITPLRSETHFEWTFATPERLPQPLLTLTRAAVGYGGRRVLDGLSLSINPGDRIGILGRNGAGKSTLMRLLAGLMPTLAGELERAPDTTPGFLAQLEVEQLDAQGTPLSELIRRVPGAVRWSEQQRRDHLGRFGFGGERAHDAVARFSGGERARLALAILIAARPNLLLLDEPTNHLDLAMRHQLLLALQDFTGAVVVVSHDRALLRGVSDSFLLVAGGAVRPFEGDLEDYAAWLSRAGDAPTVASATAPSRREERRRAAEARNRLTPLRAEQRRLEAELESLARERVRIELDLADPATWSERPGAQRQQLARRHDELLRTIGATEERWLEVSSELEAAASGSGPPGGRDSAG